jgi:hypothetical protein
MLNLVSVRLAMVLVSVQDRCTVCTKHTISLKIILDGPDEWKLVSVCLEIVLILTQDTCMVCTERTIGSEIILDAPNGTPR